MDQAASQATGHCEKLAVSKPFTAALSLESIKERNSDEKYHRHH
jgi:hypothetical protein